MSNMSLSPKLDKMGCGKKICYGVTVSVGLLTVALGWAIGSNIRLSEMVTSLFKTFLQDGHWGRI